MTGAEVTAAYFTPFHYILYLSLVLAISIAYYQWAWTKKCSHFVKVLVVKPDGSTDTEYAPKSGGYVTLKSRDNNTTRLWPINKLSAIEELYPGDGFIPEFLQKKIKTVIVDDEDWEPLLNRGSYTAKVASPDVVRALRDLADKYPKAAEDITELADSLSTAPTRDMVASPAVLGNVMKEKVSEMAVTISKDTFDRLEGIARRLDRIPNAIILYAGLGLICILLAVVLVKVFPALEGMSGLATAGVDLAAIKAALGVH